MENSAEATAATPQTPTTHEGTVGGPSSRKLDFSEAGRAAAFIG
jgi:hypothetical protein